MNVTRVVQLQPEKNFIIHKNNTRHLKKPPQERHLGQVRLPLISPGAAHIT